MRNPYSFFLLFAFLLLPWMVSDQSFWIDEGSTGLFARQPNLTSWWRYLEENTSSESQLPLSLLFTWLWARVAGTSEWTLRALNLLWGAMSLWALTLVGRRLRVPWLPLFCAIQPYFWFYTGEARPFALQIAIGSWLLVAFVEFLQTDGSETRWSLLFTGAALVLSCTTMLAPVTLVSVALVGATFCLNAKRKLPTRCLWVIVCGAALSVPLGFYYAETLARGAKGAELWTVDLRYLGYIFYELSGLVGLGPPSTELRAIAHASYGVSGFLHQLGRFALPMLWTATFGWILLSGRNALRERSLPHAGIFLAVFLTGTLLFFVASVTAQKAFWARHYAPLFPFYVTALALIVAAAVRMGGRVTRAVTVISFSLLIYSSFSLRFAERHRRDDYRSAAAFAKAALQQGRTVWWVAGPEAGEYYQVPLAFKKPEQGRAFCPLSHTGFPETKRTAFDLATLPLPQVVIISKPETFDTNGTIMARVSQAMFQPVATFRTFTVWQAP